MKYVHIRRRRLRIDGGRPRGQSVNFRALLRRLRIAIGGHNDGQRGATIPLGIDAVEGAGNRMLEQLEQVAAQSKQDHFGFRVSESRVEFDDARISGFVDHQPRIQEAGERRTFARHPVDHRTDDLAHHAVVNCRSHDRRRRIGAHASGVRPGIAVAQPLVILAGCERKHMTAVGHRNEARFLAVHEFLDDDTRGAAGVLNCELVGSVVIEDRVERDQSFVEGHCNDDTFACG